MDTKLIKVLLIEDDEDDYCLVRDILSDIKGGQYDLEWVDNYEAGLQAICRNDHDICLLDYRLGENTGLDLLSETARCSCKIPIILLTGEGGHDVDVEAMNAGAADFLVKGQMDAPGLERSIRYATARQQAEEALRESEERLRLTLDAVSDGGWDWNVATGEVRYSDRWLESLGYKPDEVEPHFGFWGKIVHPGDMPRVMEALKAHFEGHAPRYDCESRLRTASGEYRWGLDRGRVVARDADGKPLRMVGTETDITQRKRAEEELAATVDELQRFNRLMMGREERMIELKREVNEMARKAGVAPPYDSALVQEGRTTAEQAVPQSLGGPTDA